MPKHMSRSDRAILQVVLKMGEHLTGRPCRVTTTWQPVRSQTRYVVLAGRVRDPIAVAPRAGNLTEGLNKLADVLSNKVLRDMEAGAKLLGYSRGIKDGHGSLYLRDHVVGVCASKISMVYGVGGPGQ